MEQSSVFEDIYYLRKETFFIVIVCSILFIFLFYINYIIAIIITVLFGTLLSIIFFILLKGYNLFVFEKDFIKIRYNKRLEKIDNRDVNNIIIKNKDIINLFITSVKIKYKEGTIDGYFLYDNKRMSLRNLNNNFELTRIKNCFLYKTIEYRKSN